MNASSLLALLKTWHRADRLRSLDAAFARFIHEFDPAAPPSLLLFAALLAHLEGQGHSCLPVDELLRDPAGTLAWPEVAQRELTDLLAQVRAWPSGPAEVLASWQGWAAVQVDPVDDHGRSPLVLSGQRLYLRRQWRQEVRLATSLRQRVQRVADGLSAQAGEVADLALARETLDRLFPDRSMSAGTDWQKLACALALRGRLTLITGGPGTGKTYTAARLLVLLQTVGVDASRRPGAASTAEPPRSLRIALAAPTGKAAARLRESITAALEELAGAGLKVDDALAALPALTLHALLGARVGTRRLARDAAHPLDVDLLIVDEASMVPLEMMSALFDALPAQARIVMLGDKDQLASVEAGDVLGDLCRGAEPGQPGFGYREDSVQWLRTVAGLEPPADSRGPGSDLAQQTVVLRESRRFSGAIGQLAAAVNRGDAGAALQVLTGEAHGPVAVWPARQAGSVLNLVLNGRDGAEGAVGYSGWLRRLADRPSEAAQFNDWALAVLHSFDDFRVLCALRDGPFGVSGLNDAIERLLVDRGLLHKRGEWYEGRPVVITRNDPALGVFNGDIGIALRSPRASADGAGGVAGAGAGNLRVWFAGAHGLHSLSVTRLADVQTAFAMTVHKSQGSEFGHVLLVLPDQDRAVLTRELVYTGITRARRAFTLAAAEPSVLAQAIARRTRRFSGLADRLVDVP